MPSLMNYKKMLGSYTDGQVRKCASDQIMEWTWNEDIESKIGYFYDYYLDDEPLKYKDLNPQNSKTKIPIDVKFIVDSHNSTAKDQVAYKIQFKPSFKWNENQSFSFYQERFIEKYDAEAPIGMFVDLPDEKGKYRKWLVTAEADWLDNQFPTWYVLPCDFVFCWVYDNKLYRQCGVSRSQNSYNAGTWSSRGGAIQTTIPENQRICLLSMNEMTSTIFYDQRIVISSPIQTPVVWKCTKVDNTNPKGINTLTFSQDRWNEHTDAFEYYSKDGIKDFSNKFEPNKKVLGIYANYYVSAIEPTEQTNKDEKPSIYGNITYNALPQLKVGGSYKKFTIQFYDNNGEIPIIDGIWKFEINNKDVSDLVTTNIDLNTIKVKFLGNDSYIGTVMNIKYITYDSIETSVDVEIVGL